MAAPAGMMPQGPMGGTTPGVPKPPGAGGNPLDANRSVFNSTDVAYGKSAYQGGQGGQPSIKEFVEQILKVPGGVDAPVTQLVSALSSQRQNATVAGKMQNMGRPGQAPGGQPRPPMPPMGAGATPPRSPMGGLGGGSRPPGPAGPAGGGASRLNQLAGAMGGAR